MIEGFCDSQFRKVQKAFKNNFEEKDEIGASVCAYHNHKKVIDLWGGYKDQKRTEAWEEDTLVPIFSASKAIAASCLASLHSKGLFQYSDKVSEHWPEFAENGKRHITIEQLLQHRAGLSAIDKTIKIKDIKDREKLEEILAQQKPHWEAGKYQGYHVWNIGWYISILISKIDPEKRRLKEFIEQEINPNIESELHIGINEEFDIKRIATLKPFSKLKGMLSMPFNFVLHFFNPFSLSFKSMLNPSFVGDHTNFNKKQILKLEIGSGNGIANARSLASLFDRLENQSNPLQLSKSSLDYLHSYPVPPTEGFRDLVFKEDAFRFHAGFMKASEKHNFSDSKKAYGGFGAGGSFVFNDPDKKVSLAYTMNNMSSKMMNMERELNIRNALFESLK